MFDLCDWINLIVGGFGVFELFDEGCLLLSVLILSI